MELNKLMMTYRLIVTPDGQEFLFRDDGKGITQDEQQRLFRAITASKIYSRNRRLLKSFAYHLERLNYIFPTSPADMRSSGPCVYWAIMKKYPGAVKIGQTKSLVPRIKTLWSSEGEKPKILAFAPTVHFKEVEAAFHVYFSDDLMYGREWFDIDAVVDTLAEYDPRWYERLEAIRQ